MNVTYGLLGEKLSHSFSPLIHRLLDNPNYQLIPLPPDEVGNFLSNGTFQGINVTVPYKKTVIPYCTQLSPIAERIGSVNTIIRRPDGSLYGDNTDYDGFLYLVQKSQISVAGKKVLILGSGGSSLTVKTVLSDLQAGEIVVISRTGKDNYENLHLHADAQVIVNTTPVGMYPDVGVAPVCLAQFPACEGVIDIIYNPAATQLLLDAKKLKIPYINGLPMLVAQAKAASERFLNVAYPPQRIDEITRLIEWETKNIILIGMPGCGKSAVGEAVADFLHRPFVDLDKKIEELCGCSIPKIFEQKGEEAFRECEHQVLCDIAKRSGQIIACGGGIVTRPENHDPILQNSFVVYLKRDLSQLSTEDRPISQSVPLEKLYAQRAPLYESLAQLTVDNNTKALYVAAKIVGRLHP